MTKITRNCPYDLKEEVLSDSRDLSSPPRCVVLGTDRNGNQHPLFEKEDILLARQVSGMITLLDRLPLDAIDASIWEWYQIIKSERESASLYWSKRRREING